MMRSLDCPIVGEEEGKGIDCQTLHCSTILCIYFFFIITHLYNIMDCIYN